MSSRRQAFYLVTSSSRPFEPERYWPEQQPAVRQDCHTAAAGPTPSCSSTCSGTWSVIGSDGGLGIVLLTKVAIVRAYLCRCFTRLGDHDVSRRILPLPRGAFSVESRDQGLSCAATARSAAERRHRWLRINLGADHATMRSRQPSSVDLPRGVEDGRHAAARTFQTVRTRCGSGIRDGPDLVHRTRSLDKRCCRRRR